MSDIRGAAILGGGGAHAASQQLHHKVVHMILLYMFLLVDINLSLTFDLLKRPNHNPFIMLLFGAKINLNACLKGKCSWAVSLYGDSVLRIDS